MLTPILATLLQMAGPAASAPCTVLAPPPAGLEAWRTTGTDAVTVGQRAALTLGASAATAFVVMPGRAPAADTFSAVRDLVIVRSGTYRIALSAGAWIDVIDGAGKSLASTAHTEGPACSGIRKIVDFPLDAGRYTLQLSGAKAAALYVLVVPK